MLEVLETRHVAGLALFAVDVTTVGGARPLPEWMFRLTAVEVQTVPIDRIVPMVVEFYQQHKEDTELASAWFRVFFESCG